MRKEISLSPISTIIVISRGLLRAVRKLWSNIEDCQCLSIKTFHRAFSSHHRVAYKRKEKRKTWMIEKTKLKEGRSYDLICHNCLYGSNTNTKPNIHY